MELEITFEKRDGQWVAISKHWILTVEGYGATIYEAKKNMLKYIEDAKSKVEKRNLGIQKENIW